MKFTVERIEEDIVILEKEDLTYIQVPVASFPKSIKEGNIIFFDGVCYSFDNQSETDTRKRIAEKQKKIFNKRK